MSGFGTNPIVQLKDLLEEPGLAIATVVSSHADGTKTVEYPGGQQQRVRASASLGIANGSKAFVRDGMIEGEAPALSSVSSSIG